MKGENEIKDSTVVTNWGWGICQIDRGPTGTVSRIVYDWRHNVDEMNSVLREKRAIYRTFWRFHTNSKNYVPNVMQSAGLTEVE